MDNEPVPQALRISAAISWRFLVIAAAIALVALILATLRLILLPAIVALLLSTAFVPPTRWLADRGVPNALATIAVMVTAALGLALMIGVMVTLTILNFDEVKGLQSSVDSGVEQVKTWVVDSPLDISESEADRRVQEARDQIRSNASRVAVGAFSGALIVVEVIAGAALTVVMLFFFVNDGRRIWRWVVSLFPKPYEDDVHAIGVRGWAVLSAYARGQVGVAIFDAGMLAIVLAVLGVPFLVPITLFVFLGAFVPVIGAFVTGFVAVMAALAGQGATAALIVLVALIVIQQLEGQVVAPLLIGRSVRLHPIAIILAVTTGGVIWGIPGTFVAVPMTAIVTSTVSYLAHRSEHADDGGGEADGGDDAPHPEGRPPDADLAGAAPAPAPAGTEPSGP